jgi:hypothetical protein
MWGGIGAGPDTGLGLIGRRPGISPCLQTWIRPQQVCILPDPDQ